jgi:hypothetical protein
MVAPSSKPRFERRPVYGMLSRMESHCLNCGKFVASSESVKVLEIAEKAHVCRPVEDCIIYSGAPASFAMVPHRKCCGRRISGSYPSCQP